MIIDCIADLHGHYPKLEGGDLLIVAGDLTARDEPMQYKNFFDWMINQNYRCKILVGGNHDNYLQRTCMYGEVSKYLGRQYNENDDLIGYGYYYLCDSGTEFEGLKIYGSPWTKTFPGMNPKCKAFTVDTEEELASKFSLIPEDTDILITHSPPYGILDKIQPDYRLPRIDISDDLYEESLHMGSRSLALKVGSMENPPKLWCWGHIHEAYGIDKPVRKKPCKMINCSHVNERYEPVNKPIRIIL